MLARGQLNKNQLDQCMMGIKLNTGLQQRVDGVVIGQNI